MPAARLAVIPGIRRSPPEQGRPPPRAAAAAGQSTTATARPVPGLAVTVTNRPAKSSRSSQAPAISSSAAAPAASEPTA
jgi:hypothetical protein